MFGFLLGTACLFGLFKVMRGRRGGYHACGHRGGGWGRFRGGPWDGGWERGDGGGPWFLRRLFERLETTPGQERVIAQAWDELRGAMEKLCPTSKSALWRDLAGAFRPESFDEGAAAKFNVEAEEMFNATKSAMVEALRKVHEALDPRQRALLADMFERGGGFFGFGHPYRARHAGAGWV